MFVRLLAHSFAHLALDLDKIGNVAIVHDSVDSERKRMVVCRRDCGCGGSSNVCKYYFAGCIAADGAEIGVVERRLDCFVQRRVEVWLYGVGFVLGRRECSENICVPCHSKAIDVEEAVAGCDFSLGGWLCVNAGIVGEELGEVMLMDLLAESMGWSCRKALRGSKWRGRWSNLLTRTSSRRQGSELEMYANQRHIVAALDEKRCLGGEEREDIAQLIEKSKDFWVVGLQKMVKL